jgi:RNA polymerase sigma factor (sigma-70 family)
MDVPFLEFYPALYRFVCARLPGDPEAAQDIVQQIFLDLAEQHSRSDSGNSFRGESAPLTWLCAIARRRIMDLYRQRIRAGRFFGRGKYRPSFGIEGQMIADPRVQSPEECLMDAETCRIVRTCLASLPEDQRYALVMKYVDRCPQKEIARMFGRSEKAVESLLTRARVSFSRAYRKEND